MTDKKPEQDKEAAKPKHEKEKVKHIIEEKMEKVRQHELVKPEKVEKEAEEEASQQAEEKGDGKKASKTTSTKESGKAAAKPAKVKPLPTTVFVTGKRKRAVARGFFKPGKGKIKVNARPIDLLMPDMFRLKMMEPLMLTGDAWKKFDGTITVRGGGAMGQADAVRQVIARALSELMGPEARKMFLSYDRNLIVYDSRRTEPHKPPHSSWGPRRYKQRSKR